MTGDTREELLSQYALFPAQLTSLTILVVKVFEKIGTA